MFNNLSILFLVNFNYKPGNPHKIKAFKTPVRVKKMRTCSGTTHVMAHDRSRVNGQFVPIGDTRFQSSMQDRRWLRILLIILAHPICSRPLLRLLYRSPGFWLGWCTQTASQLGRSAIVSTPGHTEVSVYDPRCFLNRNQLTQGCWWWATGNKPIRRWF